MLLRGQAADAFIKAPFISGYRPGPAPPEAAGQQGGRWRARYHRRRRSSSSAALQLPHPHSACLATCTCLFGGAGDACLACTAAPVPRKHERINVGHMIISPCCCPTGVVFTCALEDGHIWGVVSLLSGVSVFILLFTDLPADGSVGQPV